MLARFAHASQHWKSALLDLLFPPRCVACRRVGNWFCDTCRAQTVFIVPPLCERCGRPLHRPVCPYCRDDPPQIDGVRSVAFFEGALRQAIHAFKYQHRPELAAPLGAMLADYLMAHPLPVDTIIPVPLHSDRERMRGYNQSLLLAKELALRNKLRLWYNGIERTRYTPPQIELDGRQRRENVRDAFAAKPETAGARVLLIDDVCTTGATMEACSIALKRQGAPTVWGLSLARGR